MASNLTKMENMIDPEVMADMISAKVANKVAVIPFAKVDTTLQGQPGTGITVPAFEYIGMAQDVAEGEEIGSVKLTTKNAHYEIKKTGRGVDLSTESLLSGYGDPLGQATTQLSLSITEKLDSDCIDALKKAQLESVNLGHTIDYDSIIDAIDVFEEELNTEKVMFVNPKQVSQLRKDADFVSADKYGVGMNVMLTGEVGRICNTRIVPSRKVVKVPQFYTFTTAEDAKKVTVDASNLVAVQATLPNAKIGDFVILNKTAVYFNPIVKLTMETETDTSALTIYLKKSVQVKTAEDIDKDYTKVRATQHYVVALTDASKVVIAKNLAE